MRSNNRSYNPEESVPSKTQNKNYSKNESVQPSENRPYDREEKSEKRYKNTSSYPSEPINLNSENKTYNKEQNYFKPLRVEND